MTESKVSQDRHLTFIAILLVLVFLLLVSNLGLLFYLFNDGFTEPIGVFDLMGLRVWATDHMVQSCRALMQNVP
jgi:hypothetical protein